MSASLRASFSSASKTSDKRFRAVRIFWEASWSCQKLGWAICFSRVSSSKRRWGWSKKAPQVGHAPFQFVVFLFQLFAHVHSFRTGFTGSRLWGLGRGVGWLEPFLRPTLSSLPS